MSELHGLDCQRKTVWFLSLVNPQQMEAAGYINPLEFVIERLTHNMNDESLTSKVLISFMDGVADTIQ